MSATAEGVTLRERKRSLVRRLDGAGPDGEALIAKRRARDKIACEHAVYTTILSQLPVRTPRCYRMEDDDDPARAWLFLEHCDGARYDPHDSAHRRLAGRWFAALHSSGRSIGPGPALPLRDLPYYRARLASGRAALSKAAHDERLGSARLLLRDLVARCDALAGDWGAIEAACSALAPTVVHGDAKADNLMVCEEDEFVALDWGEAGWGTPVVDLPDLDLVEYAAAAGVSWSDADRDELARVGTVLRVLVVIDKVGTALSEEYVDRSLRHLYTCRDLLAR